MKRLGERKRFPNKGHYRHSLALIIGAEMKRMRRPYLKQKPILYFDENFPLPVLGYFRKDSRWKKKVKILSAIELGNIRKSDETQFAYCKRKGYTLVTSDDDFNDDTAYPFTNGGMPGIIIIKETKNSVQKIERVLANLLDFVLRTPFPKAFMTESKFIASAEGCVLRGRNAQTKEIKSMHIIAGQTKMGEVRAFFSY